jgi:hypothetical protein
MAVSLYLLMLIINLYTAFFSSQFAGIVSMVPELFGALWQAQAGGS